MGLLIQLCGAFLLKQDYLCLLISLFIWEIFFGLVWPCYSAVIACSVFLRFWMWYAFTSRCCSLASMLWGFVFGPSFSIIFVLYNAFLFSFFWKIFFLLILCGVLNKAMCSTFVEARLFVLSQFSYLSWRFFLAWLDLFVGCKLKNAPASAECAHGRRAVCAVKDTQVLLSFHMFVIC